MRTKPRLLGYNSHVPTWLPSTGTSMSSELYHVRINIMKVQELTLKLAGRKAHRQRPCLSNRFAHAALRVRLTWRGVRNTPRDRSAVHSTQHHTIQCDWPRLTDRVKEGLVFTGLKTTFLCSFRCFKNMEKQTIIVEPLCCKYAETSSFRYASTRVSDLSAMVNCLL